MLLVNLNVLYTSYHITAMFIVLYIRPGYDAWKIRCTIFYYTHVKIKNYDLYLDMSGHVQTMYG